MAYGDGTAWGLESLFEFNSLVINDTKGQYDRYRLVSISGLRDTEQRETREPNTGDDGEQIVGDTYVGGKTISLQGVIEATSVVKLRQMQEALRKAFSSRVELPLKIYSDLLYNGRNLIPNPSFEIDTSGWAGNQATLSRVAATGGQGGWALRSTATAAASFGAYVNLPIPVIAGEMYTARSQILVLTAGRQARVILDWRNAGGANQGVTHYGNYIASSGISVVSGIAPSWATQVYVQCYTNGGAVGNTFDVDGFRLTPGPGSDYFDGDTSGYNWEGAPHNSRSSAMAPVQINCKKAQPVQMDESQGNMAISREFMVALRASNPRLVNSVEKQTTITPTAGQTSASGTVTNIGADPSQPRIRITGPTGSNPQIVNTTTGQTLKTIGARGVGQWWEFDTATKRVTDQTGAYVPSVLDPTSDWITLFPGANTITFTPGGAAVSPVKADVFHRDSWL